ncbi:MAG: OmpH family outer membrane protein [Bacteroidetes bacterium]|nr:OmpH family outer membrane protein [Bacteroidota bacterium]
MKNVSTILNVVLLVAVAFLYYLHFSGKKSGISNTTNTSTSDSTVNSTLTPLLPKEIKPNKIVFVNTDTLISKLKWVKDLEKEAEAKQGWLEKNYKDKAQKYQDDYLMYQEKIQKGLLSVDQAKAADEDMKRRGEELANMEAQLQELQYDIQKKNMALKKDVTAYLNEYNKNAGYNYVLSYSGIGELLFANDSLDITNEVVAGLNEQYNQKNKKK